MNKLNKKKTYLVWLDGKHKSFVAWFRVGIVLCVFIQFAQEEHIIKAFIFVGDDIEDHMTVFLKGIHVMVDDHWSSVVLCLDLFARPSVNQVDQSLSKKQNI